MTIITAILATLASDFVETALENSYNSLKLALKRKFPKNRQLVCAIDGCEKNPDSQAWQAVLVEELEKAKVDDDPDIINLAQQLIKEIEFIPNGKSLVENTTHKIDRYRIHNETNLYRIHNGNQTQYIDKYIENVIIYYTKSSEN